MFNIYYLDYSIKIAASCDRVYQLLASRGHNKLKSELENIQNPVLHANKRKAEMLMKYWGVYYY
jgi:hypothetical protein